MLLASLCRYVPIPIPVIRFHCLCSRFAHTKRVLADGNLFMWRCAFVVNIALPTHALRHRTSLEVALQALAIRLARLAL